MRVVKSIEEEKKTVFLIIVRAAAVRVSKLIEFDCRGKHKKKIHCKQYTTVRRYTYIYRGEFLITALGIDFN